MFFDTCPSEPAEEFTCLGRCAFGLALRVVRHMTRAAGDFSGHCARLINPWHAFEIVEWYGGICYAAMCRRVVSSRASVGPCSPDTAICCTAGMEETDLGSIAGTVFIVHGCHP